MSKWLMRIQEEACALMRLTALNALTSTHPTMLFPVKSDSFALLERKGRKENSEVMMMMMNKKREGDRLSLFTLAHVCPMRFLVFVYSAGG